MFNPLFKEEVSKFGGRIYLTQIQWMISTLEIFYSTKKKDTYMHELSMEHRHNGTMVSNPTMDTIMSNSFAQ